MATLQARSGIARAAATRSGYFSQVVRITIAGTDWTSSIMRDGLTITDTGRALSAVVPLRGDSVPALGASVVIAIGSASNVMFSGVVVGIDTLCEAKDVPARYVLDCQSWPWVLNMVKPFGEFTTEILGYYITLREKVAWLLQKWAPDFTLRWDNSITADGDVICLGDKGLADTLDEIVGLIPGGRWRVDANRQIDVYAVGNLPVAQPDTLDASNALHQRTLTARKSLDQTTNQVVVKGVRSRALVPMIGNDHALVWTTMPVENVDYFNLGAGLCQIGADVYSYTSATYGLVDKTTLTGDVAIGATSIPVAQTSTFRSNNTGDTGGWIILGGTRPGEGQIVRYTGRSTTSGAGNLTGVPASGVGSVSEAVASGSVVTVCSSLNGMAVWAGFLGARAISTPTTNHSQGDEVISLTVHENDFGLYAQLMTNRLDLINGYLMGLIDNPKIRYLQAETLADVALAAMQAPTGLQALSGATRDPNLWAGRTLVVDLTEPTTISATLVVNRVTISELGLHTYHHPLRTFEAAEAPAPDPLRYIFDAAGLLQ